MIVRNIKYEEDNHLTEEQIDVDFVSYSNQKLAAPKVSEQFSTKQFCRISKLGRQKTKQTKIKP